jgi:hypothetical protein
MEKSRTRSRDRRVFFLWVLGASLSLGLASCGADYRESFYRTLQDARRDGAMDRGWIPGYLPISSHDIHEYHRIEHARTWCAFTFGPGDFAEFRSHVDGSAALPKAVSSIQEPDVSWWPDFLRGRLDTAQLQRAGFRFYLNIEPGGVRALPEMKLIYLFVVDAQTGHAYFYETIDHSGPSSR